MSINLCKEKVKASEILCSQYLKQTAQADIIVPDVCPDVLKVLRVSAKAFITNRTIQQDRAYIGGVIKLNLLYLPEDDLCGKIKCINHSFDFNHMEDVPGAKSGMNLCVEAECESATCELINSRKLSVTCNLGISIKITEETELELATSPEENSCLCTRCTPLKILSASMDFDREMTIKETLSIPQGKPLPAEILKIDARPSSCELKTFDKRATLRGDMLLTILYGTENPEESPVEFMEFSLPFTEVFEISELKENFEIEQDIITKNINCNILNSDTPSLDVEILAGVFLKASETAEISVIDDAFSEKENLEIKKKACTVERFLDSFYVQLPQKEIFEVPEYLPEIKKVCDISLTPSVCDISISDGKIQVKGKTSANLLYITSSSELPVAGCEQEYDFCHSFDLPCTCMDAVCEAKVTPEHISYTLTGDRLIELRIITALSVKCLSSDKTMLIEEIQKTDVEPETLPEIVIYFTKTGDTLWNIAKKYHISPDKIAYDNDLAPNNLDTPFKCGEKIKIIL